ncbi:MAG: hypothetical protein P8M34_05655 [Saprospiraceae bacterium]|nr:hypothetical protein [Saprospiraceae bacterium]
MNFVRILLFFLIFNSLQIEMTAQRSSQDCIYWSIEDFAEGICDNEEIPYVDKVLNKKSPVKKYMIKTDRKNKRLKKAFAANIACELYYDQYEITRYLAKGDRLSAPGTNSHFIKVKSQGTYDYLEWADGGGNGPGIGIGSGGFGSGIGLNTGLNLGKKKVTGLIYDPQRFEFNVFKNCKDFNEFLAERHPDLSYECKKKKLKIERVREVMAKLNKGVKREGTTANGEAVRFVTVFPHRSIVRNSCTLNIAGEEIPFDDVSVIDIDLDCGGDNVICIEGSEVCLDVACENDIQYVLVSRDKETRAYSIEASNEKDFEYYNRLIERRKERRK